MMSNAIAHSPSQPISPPHGLWSLWDMLNHWGYKYLVIGNALTHMETNLEVHLGLIGSSEKDRRTSDLQPDKDARDALFEKCDEIARFLEGQDLGAIPGNIAAMQAKIILARDHGAPLYATDLLTEVQKLKNDFALILSKRWFYSLSPNASKHYGLIAAFGEAFWEKFKNARDDLEHAGNCLALGEGTACVMHLMRVLEIVIRDLGNRLNVTINPKDTWGTILNTMSRAIEPMPQATHEEKHKKNQWSECRNYLWHVKNAHRDDSMHGNRAYSVKEAGEVRNAIKDFALHLIAL